MFLSVVVPVQTTFSAPATTSIHQTTQLPGVQHDHLALKSYGKLPLSFEANVGQTNPDVKFLSRGRGYTLFLTDSQATLKLTSQQTADAKAQTAILRLKLLKARPRLEGQELLEGKVNYLIGKDQ